MRVWIWKILEIHVMIFMLCVHRECTMNLSYENLNLGNFRNQCHESFVNSSTGNIIILNEPFMDNLSDVESAHFALLSLWT